MLCMVRIRVTFGYLRLHDFDLVGLVELAETRHCALAYLRIGCILVLILVLQGLL